MAISIMINRFLKLDFLDDNYQNNASKKKKKKKKFNYTYQVKYFQL